MKTVFLSVTQVQVQTSIYKIVDNNCFYYHHLTIVKEMKATDRCLEMSLHIICQRVTRILLKSNYMN